jgi:hypothetical protein
MPSFTPDPLLGFIARPSKHFAELSVTIRHGYAFANQHDRSS